MDYPSDAGALLNGGKFYDGNPAQAIPASKDKAAYYNQLWDELLHVIANGGLSPDENDLTQLQQALNNQFFGVSGLTAITASNIDRQYSDNASFGATNFNSIIGNEWFNLIVGDGGAVWQRLNGVWVDRSIEAGFGATNVNDVISGYYSYTPTAIIVGDAGKLATKDTDLGAAWILRNSGFGTSNIHAVVSGGLGVLGVRVAVGQAGKIQYAGNLSTWYSAASPFGASDVNDVTWSNLNRRFVAVGNDGLIATADYNGDIFTLRHTDASNNHYNAIAVNSENSLIVAVGQNGLVSSSSDGGLTWVFVANSGNDNFVDIAFLGNKVWMAITDSNKYQLGYELNNSISFYGGIGYFDAGVANAIGMIEARPVIAGAGGLVRHGLAARRWGGLAFVDL